MPPHKLNSPDRTSSIPLRHMEPCGHDPSARVFRPGDIPATALNCFPRKWPVRPFDFARGGRDQPGIHSPPPQRARTRQQRQCGKSCFSPIPLLRCVPALSPVLQYSQIRCYNPYYSYIELYPDRPVPPPTFCCDYGNRRRHHAIEPTGAATRRGPIVARCSQTRPACRKAFFAAEGISSCSSARNVRLTILRFTI